MKFSCLCCTVAVCGAVTLLNSRDCGHQVHATM